LEVIQAEKGKLDVLSRFGIKFRLFEVFEFLENDEFEIDLE
jgi:hypothetical protein